MHSEPSSLHRLIYALAERIHAQSELLSRRAEKPMSHPLIQAENLDAEAIKDIKTRHIRATLVSALISKEFCEGFSHKHYGGSSADNPYDRGTSEYDSWCRGFEERTEI